MAKLKRKKTTEKPTLKQRLLGRTLAGRIVRGAGAATALGVGAGALKARSYLGGVKAGAREKGAAAYKTYETNTGSSQDAGKYAEKAQRGAYVGKVKRDLGRYVGAKRASAWGEKLYNRTRARQGFAYSRMDRLSTFTMGDATSEFYGRAEFAARKRKEDKPKRRGNAITKGLKYGAGAGAILGAARGAQVMHQGLKRPEYAGFSPGAKRAAMGMGMGMNAVTSATGLGTLGALGGLGVYGVNRMRRRGEEKKRSRGIRGRLRQLRRRTS